MYAILKNGLVIHHFEAGDVSKTVEILCEKFHARMILAAAQTVCRRRQAQDDLGLYYHRHSVGVSASFFSEAISSWLPR
jgi:hypothetical protein